MEWNPMKWVSHNTRVEPKTEEGGGGEQEAMTTTTTDDNNDDKMDTDVDSDVEEGTQL